MKTLFASHLLAVLVLGCSKAAVALLVLSLQPFERITLACKVFLGLISTWTLAALIALGKQCDEPQPWNSSPERCVNQQVLYIALRSMHMLLDVVIIGLPVALLHQVQIIRWKRHQISALFAMRILWVVDLPTSIQSPSNPTQRPSSHHCWPTIPPITL